MSLLLPYNMKIYVIGVSIPRHSWNQTMFGLF